MTLHSAPPVIYPLGRSHLLGGLLLGAWILSFVLMVCWGFVAMALDWRIWLGFLSVAGAGWALFWGWQQAPVGTLAWDGQLWRWESQSYRLQAALAPVVVVLDLQRAMLLRAENQAGASLWLWVECATLPARWLDLRRAVYSPRRPARVAQDEFPTPAEPLHARPPTTP